MRRKGILLFAVLFLVFAAPYIGFAANSPGILIDGEPVSFTQQTGEPFVKAGRTMSPLRVTMESYGCRVGWDGKAKAASVAKDNIDIQIPVGKNYILVNGEQVRNDAAAEIKGGRVYLPVRVVFDALGASVDWAAKTRQVLVVSGESTFGTALPSAAVSDGASGVPADGQRISGIGALCAEASDILIYGSHMNVWGSLSGADADATAQVGLVWKNETESYPVQTNYRISDTGEITFSTGEVLNRGIWLDNLPQGRYRLMLQVVNGQKTVFYDIRDCSGLGNRSRYSVTKNGINQRISVRTAPYLWVDVSPSALPQEVYDIILDPGHGGIDSGAYHYGYREADQNLTITRMVRDFLQAEGYKVALTRGTDETLLTYGAEGRVARVHASGAKYCFSIHSNGSNSKSARGFEMYCPCKSDVSMAKYMANYIVSHAGKGASYSVSTAYRVADGVYVRNFTPFVLQDMYDSALREGFAPYTNLSQNTAYYYMIRETGARATGAYTDGRDPRYESNPYWNSSVGVESYILELVYMSNRTDQEYLLANKELYARAVADSIAEYLAEAEL